MILLDSDVLIDLLRKYPPAMAWFDALQEDEELMVSGYVVMELIQGCRNKVEQDRVQRELAAYGVVWLSQTDCDRALDVFATYRLSHKCRIAGCVDRTDRRSFGCATAYIQPETLRFHPWSTDRPTLFKERLKPRAPASSPPRSLRSQSHFSLSGGKHGEPANPVGRFHL